MKKLIATLTIAFTATSGAFAQDASFPSHFDMSEEATVLPHLSVLVNGGITLAPTSLGTFRGDARIGLANVLELGISHQESSVDYFGDPQLIPEFVFKVNLIEGNGSVPSIALLYRSSTQWTQKVLWDHVVRSEKPGAFSQGFNGSRYFYSLSGFDMIVTHDLLHLAKLTVGIGMQEFQSRDMFIFIDPAPYAENGFVARELKRELLIQGFAHLQIPVTKTATVFAEVSSLPGVAPNTDALKLTVDRVIFATLGGRFTPLPAVALDAMITRRASFLGEGGTDIRVSLSTFLQFTKLGE